MVGKPQDPDVINIVCPRCEHLLYSSEARTKKFKSRQRIYVMALLVMVLGLTAYIKRDVFEANPRISTNEVTLQNKVETHGARSTIRSFFQHLNNRNYAEAYKLTDHAKWNNVESFSDYVKYWRNLKIMRMSSKSYYSRYKADSIIHVVYSGVQDETGVNEVRSFDYHMRQYGNDWRLVRIFFAMDPETDILKNSEVPKSSDQAVRSFLSFLKMKKFKKAYRYTNNPSWGNESRFISQNGFGCISDVTVYNIRHVKSIDAQTDVVYASYYATDPCNESKEHQLYFYVSRKLDYWRIVKAVKEFDEEV